MNAATVTAGRRSAALACAVLLAVAAPLGAAPWRVDHVSVAVADLASATARYRDLQLPDRTALAALVERLRRAGVAMSVAREPSCTSLAFPEGSALQPLFFVLAGPVADEARYLRHATGATRVHAAWVPRRWLTSRPGLGDLGLVVAGASTDQETGTTAAVVPVGDGFLYAVDAGEDDRVMGVTLTVPDAAAAAAALASRLGRPVVPVRGDRGVAVVVPVAEACGLLVEFLQPWGGLAAAGRTLPCADATARLVVGSARAQAAAGVTYDPAYRVLDYPGGDVPAGLGVCTDVVVRALRAAGHDLQRLVHEDMARRFADYPKRWGLRRPDRNIDHRRVPNQKCWLDRFGTKLGTEVDPRSWPTWRPGDLVYWDLGGGLDHCGVVSDLCTAEGRPFVVHNLGGISEEDCLAAWRVTGHYRWRERTSAPQG